MVHSRLHRLLSPHPFFHESMSEAKVVGEDEVELTLRLSVENAIEIIKRLSR